MAQGTDRTAFIIGGTGQIGTAVTDRLTRDGWSVLIAHRGEHPGDPRMAERDVTTLRLDRDDTDSLLAAARGNDLVLDTSAYDIHHAEQLARLAADVGSLVVASTASVYCDADGRYLDTADGPEGFPRLPVPISEDQPTVDDAATNYSAQKAAMERALLAVDGLPVSILRPGAIHGPYSSMLREWFFIKRVLDGRHEVVLAYGGESRFATSATVNIAELVTLCADRPGVRVLNAVDEDALTVADIGRTIFAAMDHEVQIVSLDGPPRDGLGANPWGVPLPLVPSMQRAADELGYHPVQDYTQSCRDDIDWITDVVGGAARREKTWREVFPELAERSGADGWFDYAAEDAYRG